MALFDANGGRHGSLEKLLFAGGRERRRLRRHAGAPRHLMQWAPNNRGRVGAALKRVKHLLNRVAYCGSGVISCVQ
ncbi:MAG: hypothetical protein DMG69_21345 [Acidobacteria bacterium]|nr:MAG: hypothetical protein DMG69_21345 [Acidobacteriota bacterium]